ncbi:helicase-related protein [Uliginosibacterium sp. 31-12]|uniref:helicase-related protein n=1 Tax=Uliginosibacterium sp. 31-12 TaxID=3062781 RepID=UPI0026E483F6|nr:helicase-related protein [Uliginosibacterium sp. 31-12]MDO6386340.1 helicase-related protein [Uliginosibacterium sp. 31-12]
MPHTAPPSDAAEELELAASDDAIEAYLARFNARLIHGNDAISIEVSGEAAGVPFRLVPDRGSLARVMKWRKLHAVQRLALVQERLNADTLAELQVEIEHFIAGVERRARQAGLDALPLLGALQTGRELASRRFQVVEDRLAEALFQQKEHSQAEAALHSVRLARYPESFELATGMRRRFIAILGPTNSGKTHQAMEALAAAASGVYLAPLRLLALENYERLVDRDVAVSLVTGEERRLTEGATHVASTIEMMDATRAVEIAIIDEIQMLEDLERGSAWTAAVCGVPAKTVYLLGSLAARPAIEALAQRLECPLEVITLQRKSPLEMEAQCVGNVGKLQRGDALIAFSRREVLEWAANITKAGLKVATIYGNLSPEVRRAQAQRFRDGEADVVVATDAIGMGLNLPIRRVVFSTAKKYDGISEDILPAWLTHQIAGRAGRYGIHEAGHIAGFDDHTHRLIARLMKTHASALPRRGFYVTPSLQQLEAIARATGEKSLAKLLELFSRNIDLSDDFFLPGNLEEQINRALWLDQLRLPLAQRFTFSLVPISSRVPMLNDAWQGWARNVSRQRPNYLSEDLEAFERARFPLQAAEDACKKYSAYAWLGYRLPDYFPDAEAAVAIARETSERVDQMLASQHQSHQRAAVRDDRFGHKSGQRRSSGPSRGGHLRRGR